MNKTSLYAKYPTPMTNNETDSQVDLALRGSYVSVEFARDLERELSGVSDQRDMALGIIRKLENMLAFVKEGDSIVITQK
jgi:hypothetical protein